MSELNYEPEEQLNITLIESQKVNQPFPFYQADGVTALNLSGTFKFTVSATDDNKNILRTLIAGDGLTVVTNTLTIDFSKITDLPPGKYFFDLWNDKPDLSSVPVFEGTITINPKKRV